jgi:hypothetical protein
MNSRIQLKELEPLLELGISGCHQVHSVLADAVREHTQFLLDRRKQTSNNPTSKALENDEDDDEDDDDHKE